MSPEVDVAAALATALSLTVGTDIKYGPRRSVVEAGDANVTIWVHATGGPAPMPFLNATVEGSFYDSSVQVVSLSASDDFAGGLTTARAIRDALHTKTISGYVICVADQSEPFYLGQIAEADGQHEWSQNFSLKWKG